MILFANAKINLGLQVTEKRTDNYHNLCSVFYPLPIYDVIELTPTEGEFEFVATGLDIPDGGENLCVKAYNLLKADFEQIKPIRLHLHKNIPIGAGLGGGSSDASFVLKGLNEMFELGLSSEELKTYDGKLGADCPFFIDNTPQLATGIGTDLEDISLSLKDFYIVLVKPEIHISTAEAYSNVTPMFTDVNLKEAIQLPVQDWKFYIKNDFEEGIFKLHKQIRFLKEAFYAEGAVYASMTGSGSAVYGIFWEKQEVPNLAKFGTIYYPTEV